MGGILIQTLAFAMMGPAQTVAHGLPAGRDRPLPVAADRALRVPARPLLRRDARVDPHHRDPARHRAARRLAHATAASSRSPRAALLLLVFATAIVWIGIWLGIFVRSPDAVMGIGFVIIFPLTFISNAFVPISSMPRVLQWFAVLNPVSVLISATRELFGNPIAPVSIHVWPMDHPVLAAWLYTIALVAIGWCVRAAALQRPHHRVAPSARAQRAGW